MKAYEINFDGLVGPTHMFSGLAFGNVASEENLGKVSSPKKAALQGLEKMKIVHDLGLKQGFFLPQPRPVQVQNTKGISEQDFFFSSYSSSFMWTANAGIATPSIDSKFAMPCFTPANLISKYHRSLELPYTTQALKNIFPQAKVFPAQLEYGDEGAANHTRFCHDYSSPGLHFYVYGKEAGRQKSKRYPARQSREAFEHISRQHKISEVNYFFAEQSPEAIDAGVFHNDVISTGNLNFFLAHEKSFVNQAEVVKELEAQYLKLNPESKFFYKEVSCNDVSLADTVSSYLFNSQIITLPDSYSIDKPYPEKSKPMMILAAQECKQNTKVKEVIDRMLADSTLPLVEARYVDLNESMNNGGGPACLRFRVVLTEEELGLVNSNYLLDEAKYQKLKEIISNYYPEELNTELILKPETKEQVQEAYIKLDELLKCQ